MIYLRSKKSDVQKENTQAAQGDYTPVDWSKVKDADSNEAF